MSKLILYFLVMLILSCNGTGSASDKNVVAKQQDSKGEDYAELYVNINPDEHGIELHEKDEEYRPALLRVLGE